MGSAEAGAAPSTVPSEPERVWSPRANPAVAELLDHVAEELAREYVRLMESAAEADGAEDRPTGERDR